MKSTAARRSARPTLGAARPWITAGCATAQWRARFARRYPPPLEPPLANRAFPSFCGGPNPCLLDQSLRAKHHPFDPRKQTPVADIKSEPRPASNRNRWPASCWNARPASSESAFHRRHRLAGHPGEGADLPFQGDRLSRASAVLQGLPVALGSPAGGPVHPADAMPPPPAPEKSYAVAQTRTATRQVSGHYPAADVHAFRVLAAELDMDVQELLAEALNMVFERHGRPNRLVPDGDPEGVRIIDFMNWNGKGVVFRRQIWPDVKQRGYLAGTGIYILVGAGDDVNDDARDLNLPVIYIGQSEDVVQRNELHNKSKEKEWDWAIVFVSTSSGGGLNRAHAKWLEYALIEQAKKARQCTLANAQDSNEPALSAPDKADTRRFLKELLQILPLVGLRVFEVGKVVAAPKATTPSTGLPSSKPTDEVGSSLFQMGELASTSPAMR